MEKKSFLLNRSLGLSIFVAVIGLGKVGSFIADLAGAPLLGMLLGGIAGLGLGLYIERNKYV